MNDRSRRRRARAERLAPLVALSCGSLLVGCKWLRDPEFAVQPGREPAGTCAIEGFLRGDTDSASSGPVTIVVSWTDDATRREGGGSFRVVHHDNRFRVAGLPCVGSTSFGISARTDSGRGGALHSTFGGNVASLWGQSGSRLVNVRIDLSTGARFRGVIRDARTGAPVAGVRVNAVYQTYGRDGWGRPQEFAISDAAGEYILYGVQSRRVQSGAPPSLGFNIRGYESGMVTTTFPAEGREQIVNATITPQS